MSMSSSPTLTASSFLPVDTGCTEQAGCTPYLPHSQIVQTSSQPRQLYRQQIRATALVRPRPTPDCCAVLLLSFVWLSSSSSSSSQRCLPCAHPRTLIPIAAPQPRPRSHHTTSLAAIPEAPSISIHIHSHAQSTSPLFRHS